MVDAAKAIVAEWLEEFPLPELVEREVAHPPIHRLKDILAVVGPRRAGKTFFFFQLIRELMERHGVERSEILFVDFEDYRMAALGDNPADALLTAFYQLAGKEPSYLFFDEVQQLSNWSRVVRTLHNRRAFKLIISGSNSRLLSREVATELRGRCVEAPIFPFSFREFLRLRGETVTRSRLHTAARGRILGVFDDYLRNGGFPDVAARDSPVEKRQLLQSYFQTIYYKDIVERYAIRAKETLESMMRQAVDQTGGLFSISAFTKILQQRGQEASKRTVANYLGYLEEAFFLILAEKFAFSQRKRTANPVKSYLFDTGFRQLAVNFSQDRGKLLENLVAIELRRRGKSFFYYRDRGECDFVVLEGGKAASAIQVCWELAEHNRDRETGGLLQAARALETRTNLILTYNDSEQTGGYSVVPVWRWLLDTGTPGPVTGNNTQAA